MPYEGNIAPMQVTEGLNNVHYDVKRALRVCQSDINVLVSDLANPNKMSMIIDGREILKSNTVALQIALSDKMGRLENQTTTILSVFTEMYKMEKSVGGSSA